MLIILNAYIYRVKLFLNQANYNTLILSWRDVQRKNDVNNAVMSSLRAPWQNGPLKNQHTEQHTEHEDATDI